MSFLAPTWRRSLPASLVALWLAVGLYGCSTSKGDAPGEPAPRDAAEANACRLNSDCPPGWYCLERRCAFDCREDRDCEGRGFCVNGQCLEVDAAPPDAAPRDAGPVRDAAPIRDATRPLDAAPEADAGGPCGPGGQCPAEQVCIAGVCTWRCERTGCRVGEICDAESGLCLDLPPDCRRDGCPAPQVCNRLDGQCEPPPDCRREGCGVGLICDEASGRCGPADCRVEGCPLGDRCDDVTGRCQPAMDLGDECDRGADCASGICLELVIAGRRSVRCATLCCSESDCPAGFGCMESSSMRGARFCLSADIYPANFTFERNAGGDCRAGVGVCRSGLCDNTRERDVCMGTCCMDADCGGRICRWTSTNPLTGEPEPVCDLPIGFGRTGDPCEGLGIECLNNVCIFNPDAQPGFPPGICADLCCRHADCPPPFGCGQVIGPGNKIISACVPLTRGQDANGEACGDDTECQSGHCVENRCREPCCRPQDCAPPENCLPRPNGEGGIIRVCEAPDL